MRWTPLARRWTTCWAVWALLFATLAPSLAHAVLPASGWAEVCTAQGSKWIRADATPSPGKAVHPHCALCATHELPPGLPAAATATVEHDPVGTAPVSVVPPAHARHAWCSALPRAPPGQA